MNFPRLHTDSSITSGNSLGGWGFGGVGRAEPWHSQWSRRQLYQHPIWVSSFSVIGFSPSPDRAKSPELLDIFHYRYYFITIFCNISLQKYLLHTLYLCKVLTHLITIYLLNTYILCKTVSVCRAGLCLSALIPVVPGHSWYLGYAELTVPSLLRPGTGSDG